MAAPTKRRAAYIEARMESVAVDALTAQSASPSARAWLADELYDAWRAARGEALTAYRDWSDAKEAVKRDAYAVYLAAADRESAAAATYARVVGERGRTRGVRFDTS
jgi:hypothetical protein